MSKNYTNFDWSPIINWESGGKAYYEKFLNKFTWPGGASGPTIMIGVDCGYYTKHELEQIFDFLPRNQIELVKNATGKTGATGKAYINTLKGITVGWDRAIEIFETLTLPKFYNLTLKTWPGTDKLCESAQVALTSIIFNRGSSLKGDSRKEMRAIAPLVAEKDYKAIAEQIIAMKRLWRGKGLDGLLKRRDEEAKLVLSCS
jgi:GH24 family phage-related lysozyme (muramidase)